VKWDIVPAVNLDLSPKSLEEGGNALRATEKSYQKDGELIAKSTTFVMDPNLKFVIKVLVHDPYGDSGIDPALLGKGGNHVKYNAAFKATLNGEQPTHVANEARQQKERAPAEAGMSIQV
jgi:hypothetical protein